MNNLVMLILSFVRYIDRKNSVYFLAITLSFLPSMHALADIPDTYLAKVIGSQEIIVEGNQRIESETILSYLDFPQDKSINSGAVERALKKLYDTEWFSEVKITPQKHRVIVYVKENPIIYEIAFEGNKKVKEVLLRAEIKLRPRTVYTPARVQEDVQRIIDVYRKQGRFSASVIPQKIELSQNRVSIIYAINEGERTHIRDVTFIGNNHFDSQTLKEVITTRETVWYRFFSSADQYDPERLEYDQEQLRQYYLAHGYADFRIISAVGEFVPSKDAFNIVFAVEEGVRYTLRDVKIESDIENIATQALTSYLETHPGDVFNAVNVEKTVDIMIKHLGEKGYAFVDIEPVFDKHPEEKKLDIRYVVKEGAKAYVNEINISGNSRTLDKVIRREFQLVEGDPFNVSKINRTEQRIRNLDFFERFEMKTRQKEGTEDQVDIDVDVVEKSTGEFYFMAGYSTTDGPFAGVNLNERNLIGKGIDFNLMFKQQKKGKEVELGFTQPYFMDKNVAVGIDFFNVSQDRIKESAVEMVSRGSKIRAVYGLTDYLYHGGSVTLEKDHIKVQNDASIYAKKQQGHHTALVLGQYLTYDRRDNRLRPTEGYYVRLSQDVAGLAGNTKYIYHEVKGAYYVPVWDKTTFRVHGKASYITGYGGKEVRMDKLASMGGDDVRGFHLSGIGPQDKNTRESIGGKLYYSAGVETNFPIGLPEELGFKGALFVDTGSLSKIDGENPAIFDRNSLRVSTGAGIVWDSRLGLFRLDYAFPIRKEKFDKKRGLNIGFGTQL